MIPGLSNSLFLFNAPAAQTPVGPGPTLVYQNTYSGSGGSTGGVTASIGAEAADRIVIVVIWLSNGASSSISNVKIGSLPASTLISYNTGYEPALMAQLLVPTGSTALVEWTGSNAPDNYGVAVYTLTSYTSSLPTWTGSQYSGTTATTTLTTSSLPNNSVGVFSYQTYRSFPSSPWTSGNVTQDSLKNPQGSWSVAHLNSDLSGVQNISATWSGTNTPSYVSMIGATWR
jgi:hypothetical protein